MSLPIDDIVRVTDTIEPTGVLLRVFGIGLFITNDSGVGSGAERVKVYSSNRGDFATSFPETTETYKCAQKWFSQVPYPKNFVVGRWFDVATTGVLSGGKVGSTPTQLAGLADTGFLNISINSIAIDVAVDFTATTSYADAATAIQTALTTASATVTVDFDPASGGFVISTTNTGDTAIVDYASTPASGVDLSTTLALTSTLALSKTEGAAVESLSEAYAAISALNDSFYFVLLDHKLTTSENVLLLSDLIETRRKMFTTVTDDPTTLNTGETTSLAAQLFAKQPARTWMTYNQKNDYSDASIAARFSSVNFQSADSVITAKFKQLPTIAADSLNETQVTELERKRVDYYTNFADRAIYSEGTAFSLDTYIDVRYALDWFVNAIQVGIFDLLYASGRVSQADQGEATIVSVFDKVCQQAVKNGMIAGGTVGASMRGDIILSTGNSKFNGVLAKAYLIWSQSTAAQSLADRDARKATAKKIWLKSSGAIHSVDLDINLES